MLHDALHQVRPTEQQTGLRAAQQLIGAGRHQVDAGKQAVLHARLGRQAIGRRVEQRATSQVMEQPQLMLPGDGGQRFQLDALGEADHLEVAGVHLHDGHRFRRDRSGVIFGAGSIRGADLDHTCTRKAHDLRHSKSAADLDQLAAGNDDLLAPRQCRQHQEHRGGAIVDNRGGLGAGQVPQQLAEQVMAPASPAGQRIEFDGRVRARHAGDGFRRGPRQRSPAEVGMENHSGGIHDRPEPRPSQFSNQALNPGPPHRRLSDGTAGALLVENALHREPHQRAAMRADHRDRFRFLEELMHARERAKDVHQNPVGRTLLPNKAPAIGS